MLSITKMCQMIKLGVKNDNFQKKFMQGRSLSPCTRETCLKKKKSHARLKPEVRGFNFKMSFHDK